MQNFGCNLPPISKYGLNINFFWIFFQTYILRSYSQEVCHLVFSIPCVLPRCSLIYWLLLTKNDKKLNKHLPFRPISTILGRKVDIVGHYFFNLHVKLSTRINDLFGLATFILSHFPVWSDWNSLASTYFSNSLNNNLKIRGKKKLN